MGDEAVVPIRFFGGSLAVCGGRCSVHSLECCICRKKCCICRKKNDAYCSRRCCNFFHRVFFFKCFVFWFVMLQPLSGDVATVVLGCCNRCPGILQPLSGDCNRCPRMLQLLSGDVATLSGDVATKSLDCCICVFRMLQQYNFWFSESYFVFLLFCNFAPIFNKRTHTLFSSVGRLK